MLYDLYDLDYLVVVQNLKKKPSNGQYSNLPSFTLSSSFVTGRVTQGEEEAFVVGVLKGNNFHHSVIHIHFITIWKILVDTRIAQVVGFSHKAAECPPGPRLPPGQRL